MKKTKIMNRTQIYLPLVMSKKLKKDADKEGIAMSEVIRRIISAHYNAKNK